MIILGATKNPLDASFTVPGLGLVITVRGLLKMLCDTTNVDPQICRLINQNAAEACSTLVGYGDTWLQRKIEDALETMMEQVLETVDCEKKNWKEAVIDSLDITFNQEYGIAIDIDEAAITQTLICALARKTISASLRQPAAIAVRKLKDACKQLAAQAPKPTSTQSPKEVAAALALFKQRLEETAANVRATLSDNAFIKAPVAEGSKLPPPGMNAAKTNAWVWWAAGLTATAGGFFLLFAKKRKR